MPWNLGDNAESILREAGADTFIPALKVYAEEGQHLVHLEAACGYGISQQVNLLSVKVEPACKTCYASNKVSFIGKVLLETNMLLDFLSDLAEIENIFGNVDTMMGDEAPIFDWCKKALIKLKSATPSKVAYLEAGKYYSTFIKKFEGRLVELEKVVIGCIKSDEGRENVFHRLVGLGSENLGDENYTHLLVSTKRLGWWDITAAHAFNDDRFFSNILAPEPFLVSGEGTVISFLKERNTTSLVFIEPGTPPEVVQTMLSLWDPDSEGALQDANNALKAAWLLVS